jgi:hypothetical protein
MAQQLLLEGRLVATRSFQPGIGMVLAFECSFQEAQTLMHSKVNTNDGWKGTLFDYLRAIQSHPIYRMAAVTFDHTDDPEHVILVTPTTGAGPSTNG